MQKWLLKHKLLILLLTVGMIIVGVWMKARLPPLSECDQSNLMTIETLNQSNPSKAHVLQPEINKYIHPIMRLPGRRVSDSLTIRFSPDDTMLAIYGMGYPREMVTETFLWKLRKADLCVLELGNYRREVDSFKNQFIAFSPDGRSVLLREDWAADKYTLWDTQYNQLINGYKNVQLMNDEDMLTLKSSQDETTVLHWESVLVSKPLIKAIIVDQQAKIINVTTGETLAMLEVSGLLYDATISHDGKQLALAFTQPDKYAPYFGETFIELWDITKILG